MHGSGPKPQPGFSEVSNEPAWTGKTTEGGQFRLFVPRGNSKTILAMGASAASSRTILEGQAAFAEVEIPRSSPLSFWHETPQSPRYFLAGLSIIPWPDTYSVEFTTTEGGQSSRNCGSLILSESPNLQLIIRSDKCAIADGLWMAFEGDVPEDIRTMPDICEDARAFVSFLVGRCVPFLWNDRFIDDTHLLRMFHGFARLSENILGNEQPLPLGRIVGLVKYASVLGPQLPILFEKFIQLRIEYNIEFIIRAYPKTYVRFQVIYAQAKWRKA
jgi:hypothetical protein